MLISVTSEVSRVSIICDLIKEAAFYTIQYLIVIPLISILIIILLPRILSEILY